ncbi:hypothetical protein AS156_18185 [Bradyrhizobium macuxiense]|uniref:Prokaryotic YEATS domain-containing protein n=1 Tax=Bradyrhizobium macuxiense TaxID=1755647 RepID=A0A120FJ19_9BRAD|nr:pYEATS domain-containing protein [Bradyrhizobium macuxiense]KWV48411.1 hypothetical protein AS156_18185 [Bradyrhizobium macuxiense]
MSSFEDTENRTEADLIVRGPVGAEIQVVDATYRRRAKGTVELKARLPQGIYMIDWSAAGQTSQKIVRLLPIEKPLVIDLNETPLFASEIYPYSSFAGPVEASDGSEVLIIVRPSSPNTLIKSEVNLRLLGVAGNMRSSQGEVATTQAQSSDSFVARFYHVIPGDYRLRFASTISPTFDQTIPAMRGRRTVVMMYVGESSVLLSEGDAYKAVEYQGIDAARTIIVSTAQSDSDFLESERLAGILLHDLAVGSGSLGAAFERSLSATSVDPLLLIYAAAVVLSCLDRQASPALDDPWPRDRDSQKEFSEKWQQKAIQWLKRVNVEGAPPDVAALRWRLETVGSSLDIKGRDLSNPPILERSWFWALAQSTRDSYAIPSGASFRAVARGGSGIRPWLVWRPAAAIGDATETGDPKTGDLRGTIEQVAERARTAFAAAGSAPRLELSIDPLALLSPEAKAMSLRTLEVAGIRSSDGFAERTGDQATDLAILFNTPAPELKHRLQQTLAELDTALKDAPATAVPTASSSRSDPPALRRMIAWPDDPNRGRFGGKTKIDDFELRAEFSSTPHADRVKVRLIVEAEKHVDVEHDQVEFFLHYSFWPNRATAGFRKSQALIDVTAWGGFTVGAWLADRNIELELNLADIPGAPPIIIER